jgi:sulfate adenylyltransferase subunit 2
VARLQQPGQQGESIRVFPSNWTELDIWQYIYLENIDIVPLYFAAMRPVVDRGGIKIMVDDERMPIGPEDEVKQELVRFRTLGCYPLTGPSNHCHHPAGDHRRDAVTTSSERQGRLIDHDQAGSMEQKKRQGYF